MIVLHRDSHRVRPPCIPSRSGAERMLRSRSARRPRASRCTRPVGSSLPRARRRPSAIRNGSLWWVSWGYVSHEAFPFARPITWRDGEVRYLRAGLVGAVRAGTGETHLWLAPGYDSLTATWARRFEPLIEPVDKLPADVRQQLAYPIEQFNTAIAQLVRASADSAADTVGWSLRPREPFELVTPDGALW